MFFAVLCSKEILFFFLFNNLMILFLSHFFLVFRSVFTNGDILVPPARIRIPKYTLRNWENVLAMVTQKVRLRTGAVYR